MQLLRVMPAAEGQGHENVMSENDMGASINRGPQNRPKYIMVLIIGTTKLGPLILETAIYPEAFCSSYLPQTTCWAAVVKDLKRSYHCKKTLQFSIDPHSGNFVSSSPGEL